MAQPSTGDNLRSYVERMRALTKSVVELNARIHSRDDGSRSKHGHGDKRPAQLR
jgi:hypothetical protein